MSSHNIKYRDYQIAGRDAAFKEHESGNNDTCVVLPTGTGKTCLAGMAFEQALERGRKGLFLAHREVLIRQAHKTISAFGFDTAVEMASESAREQSALCGQPEVVVGSVQSLQGDRLFSWDREAFGYIVVDECHRVLAEQHQNVLNYFQGYWHLGITATPDRGDDRNIGSVYSKAYEYSLRQAIRDRWLAPLRTRTCKTEVDLRGIKMHGGDFALPDLVARLTPKVEKLARAFFEEIGDRPFVYFTPDVGSANLFAAIATKLGHPCEYVAGVGGEWGMGKDEKNEKLGRFADGAIQGVVCCDLLFEGWDAPHVQAVGIGRPTRKRYRYTQMVGRGTRPSPSTGKTDCIIVDFDWQTDPDVKDICLVVDLFDDGSLDPEVRDFAAKKERERKGKSLDPVELIEEAERVVKVRKTLHVSLSGKHAKYEVVECDPVGVGKLLDVKLNRKYDIDTQGRNPASQAQKWKLKSLGVEAAETMSKWGASKLISKLEKRKQGGFASPQDVKILLRGGVSEDIARSLSAGQAQDYIAALIERNNELTQGSLFQ
jgi:superfamily II DNA or RNA helicase